MRLWKYVGVLSRVVRVSTCIGLMPFRPAEALVHVGPLGLGPIGHLGPWALGPMGPWVLGSLWGPRKKMLRAVATKIDQNPSKTI